MVSNTEEHKTKSLFFNSSEEKKCYIDLRSQVLKLLNLIEEEQEGGNDASSWFEEFIFYLKSANSLCHDKLTRVIVKINGLYDKSAYKTMTHRQIKRPIMESRGILDHLIDDCK